ncbi:uncharacterized protein LOC128231037 [Mya arenaria]|uniref:uncharacterized protein LOC128231037 n=1 Tax=Mya arenaria TaxID=6604 RepID=UPI0022E50A80|nr:uncharacterized protein LOC128231037 [Mya arenaria]
MDVLFLVGLATGVTLVTVIASCMGCRRKLSEDELQQKYFEKFRKKHLARGDLALSARVDYIRNMAQSEVQTEQQNNSNCVTTEETNHTYETVVSPKPDAPALHAQEPSCGSEHSFFDDSFQTVIEASSGSLSGGQADSNFLSVPRVSYLSLHNLSQSSSSNQQSQSSESLETQLTKNGAVNEAFSRSAESFESSNGSHSEESLSKSYVIPKCGPQIKVVKPSVRRPPLFETPRHKLVKQYLENDIGRKGSFRRHSDIGVGRTEDFDSEKDLFDRSLASPGSFWDVSDDIERKTKNKLEVEGHTQYNNRRHSYDSMSLYEKLMQSKIEKNLYKSLNKKTLLLPPRVAACSPLASRCRATDPSIFYTPTSCRDRELPPITSKARYSEHTYDSINIDLVGNNMRADELESEDYVMDMEDSSSSSEQPETSREELMRSPFRRGSRTNSNESMTEHHTYESIKSRPRSQSFDDAVDNNVCDNSVVIIGRRVSNPFDQRAFSKRMMNKKKQNVLRENKLLDVQVERRNVKELEDRYSPFPSAKKLAFKSAFNKVASPRFAMVPTVAGNLEKEFSAMDEFHIDNLNIRTPEIKVENVAQSYNNTAYLSPFVMKNSVLNDKCSDQGLVTPQIAYETIRACQNYKKYNQVNMDTQNVEKVSYKKRLPSLPDCIEDDLIKHCNVNMYAMSTPCEVQAHNYQCF